MKLSEIPTQIIFKNLIKQNQNLGSDPVLKQPTTVSSVQRPVSKIQRTESSVQHLRPECRKSVYSKTPKTNENVRSENSIQYHL